MKAPKRAPLNGAGRRRINPLMLDALREYLLKKPGLYLDEIAVFLYNEFGIYVSILSISRSLKSIKWLKKTTRYIA
jgi:hypothetical protein